MALFQTLQARLSFCMLSVDAQVSIVLEVCFIAMRCLENSLCLLLLQAFPKCLMGGKHLSQVHGGLKSGAAAWGQL